MEDVKRYEPIVEYSHNKKFKIPPLLSIKLTLMFPHYNATGISAGKFKPQPLKTELEDPDVNFLKYWQVHLLVDCSNTTPATQET